MSDLKFIQIPPESTGPRIGTIKRHVLAFDTAVNNFIIGDVVTGGTTGATGTVTGIQTAGFSQNSGVLFLEDATGTFQENEAIEVSAVQYASVNLVDQPYLEYVYQENIVTDPDNPKRQLGIDAAGSAKVTFQDGAPSLGAFGELQVGEAQIIKDYTFHYGLDSENFWDQTTGGGTLTWVANSGCVLFSTGTTSGDHVSRTSNFYHPYFPGVGNDIEMTIQVGDTGKANVRRRWGYFDDDDGLFFQLDGTALSLVKRSSTTGSVVEEVIPQAAWNIDRVNGTGRSGLILDVAKANIYFIDYQWLGAGRVRFGVILPNGSKQIIHILENANDSNLPYMRTATLPIRIEQENTGTAGSTSEMRWACAVVKHQSEVRLAGKRHADSTDMVTVQTSDGIKPLISMRPSLLYQSRTNRGIARIASAQLVNDAASNGVVKFIVYTTVDTNLTGASWTAHGDDSIVDLDTAATAIANTSLAHKVTSFALTPGSADYIDNFVPIDVHDFELYLGADGNTQPTLVLAVENVAAANCDVLATVNWMEYIK